MPLPAIAGRRTGRPRRHELGEHREDDGAVLNEITATMHLMSHRSRPGLALCPGRTCHETRRRLKAFSSSLLEQVSSNRDGPTGFFGWDEQRDGQLCAGERPRSSGLDWGRVEKKLRPAQWPRFRRQAVPGSARRRSFVSWLTRRSRRPGRRTCGRKGRRTVGRKRVRGVISDAVTGSVVSVSIVGNRFNSGSRATAHVLPNLCRLPTYSLDHLPCRLRSGAQAQWTSWTPPGRQVRPEP